MFCLTAYVPINTMLCLTTGNMYYAYALMESNVLTTLLLTFALTSNATLMALVV